MVGSNPSAPTNFKPQTMLANIIVITICSLGFFGVVWYSINKHDKSMRSLEESLKKSSEEDIEKPQEETQTSN